jgi:hypothetical protein
LYRIHTVLPGLPEGVWIKGTYLVTGWEVIAVAGIGREEKENAGIGEEG